jgi:OPT family oligopeptide transporter
LYYCSKDKTKLPLLADSSSSNNDDEKSPFEEVAINVSNKDDPTMLCLTFRSLFIGILLTCLISLTNQFFYYRTSPLDVNVGIVILLSYMIGKLMGAFLPRNIFNGILNPGPFSVKEHALITIMATSATSTTNAIETLTIQRLYYNYYLSHLNALLYIIIMHLVAFSIAGILKRYLVWPAVMIWPKTLMSCCLIRTLDREDENNELEEINTNKTRWKMSRSSFFLLMVFFQFLWYWLPGYIFPVLSLLSFACMLAPNNIVLAQVTGANGLGLGAIQLDWNAWVAYLGSPILVPFWYTFVLTKSSILFSLISRAHVNFFIGFILGIWIASPLIYYFNIWESKKMPIISNRVFDVDGYFYNTTRILDRSHYVNETAYQIYGDMQSLFS